MPSYTRHQLKQDRFSEAATETVSWAVEHRDKLIVALVAATAVIAVLVGSWFYFEQRDSQASLDLGSALRTYQAQLRAANAPAQPDVLTFTSASQRAEAAQKEFTKVVEKYPHTRSAEFARYFIGLTYRDVGNNSAAEKYLDEVANLHNKDLSALARFGLAGVYARSNREAQAIKIYEELIARPSATVPKATAQLALASIYQDKQPDAANRIYEQIRKEDPLSLPAEIASSRSTATK